MFFVFFYKGQYEFNFAHLVTSIEVFSIFFKCVQLNCISESIEKKFIYKRLRFDCFVRYEVINIQ